MIPNVVQNLSAHASLYLKVLFTRAHKVSLTFERGGHADGQFLQAIALPFIDAHTLATFRVDIIADQPAKCVALLTIHRATPTLGLFTAQNSLRPFQPFIAPQHAGR